MEDARQGEHGSQELTTVEEDNFLRNNKNVKRGTEKQIQTESVMKGLQAV